MGQEFVIDLARNALTHAVLIASPMLLIAVAVGLLVSVLQAVTQIQEQTLAFVPKLFAVGAAFLLTLPWAIQRLAAYTLELFRSISWIGQ